VQPQAQPSALETGVAGDQHPFALPEFCVGVDRALSQLGTSHAHCKALARLAANSHTGMSCAEASCLLWMMDGRNSRDHSKSGCVSKTMILQKNNEK
jgi:hypothetical protein